jgi:hypothetical protein
LLLRDEKAVGVESTTGSWPSHRCHRAVLLQWHNLPSSEQCSSTSQIPHALTIFFKSATIAFIFGRYQIDFWF